MLLVLYNMIFVLQKLDFCLNQWINYNQILVAASSYAKNSTQNFFFISKAIKAKKGQEPVKA